MLVFYYGTEISMKHPGLLMLANVIMEQTRWGCSFEPKPNSYIGIKVG